MKEPEVDTTELDQFVENTENLYEEAENKKFDDGPKVDEEEEL